MRMARASLSLLCLALLELACGDAAHAPHPSPGVELTQAVPILDGHGDVAARGWARHPIMIFERAAVPAARADRVREWDFYAVHAPDFAVVVTLAKIRFAEAGTFVIASVSVQDLVNHTQPQKALLLADPTPEPDGLVDFAPRPGGAYRVEDASGFLAYEGDAAQRVIRFDFGDALRGELTLATPPDESVALVTPWPEPGFFFYEDKALPLAAQGSVTAAGVTYALPVGRSFAVMDWVRAVVPTEIRWQWAYAMGVVDGRRVALNLGTVYGDESAGTPNGVLVDGVLHKLDRVAWTPADDASAPWRFISDDGRVDVALTPSHAYRETQDLDLGFYTTSLVKPYGVWSGTVVLDDGEPLVIDGLIGAAEEVHTTW